MPTMSRESEADFGDEEAVLIEIATQLDIDSDSLRIKEDRGMSGFGAGTVYEITIRGGKHGKEWQVVESYDAMHDLAIEIVKQDLEEDPSMFNKDFIEQHINKDRLRRDLESDVLNMIIDDLTDIAERRPDDFWDEYEREGFEAPEEDEDGERREPDRNEIEELAEKQTEERLRDPMEYLEDIYGDEAAAKAIEIAGIDINAAAEDAVDTDGAEHFVARYDGNSHETPSGFVYWRSN
jgi:hypothetical protein